MYLKSPVLAYEPDVGGSVACKGSGQFIQKIQIYISFQRLYPKA